MQLERRWIRQAAVTSLAMYSLSTATFAQDAGSKSAESKPLETVLVTATKRGEAQDVQDVPIAVTAFGADQLESLNFRNLQSLTYTVPNVQLETIGTVGGYQNFSIRGLGINSSIPSIDPTVGVFVDGVYMGVNNGVLFDNFDIESIEVLRGPQGVLFGRNVTGGAVVVRTARPSFDPSFSSRAGVSDGLNWVADFSLNGPLVTDKLAGKLAVYYNDDQGYFKNKFNGDKFGASEQYIVRPAVRWTPTEDLDLMLRVEYGKRQGDGAAGQNHALFSRDSFDFIASETGFTDNEWTQAFVEGNWKVGFGSGTITNILGWREFDEATRLDVDGTENISFHSAALTDQDQISNELRYAGTFGDVNVTTGLFYFTQDLFYLEDRRVRTLPPANALVNVVGGGEQESVSEGVFLAADWSLTDQVTLNAGARYSYEKKKAKVALIRPGGCNRAAETCMFTFSDEESWSDVSPRLGVQWQPTSDTQLYGYWTKGFRSGGYNLRQTDPAFPPGPFDSEKQSSFEIGMKQDFAGKGRVNLAVFRNDIDRIQRELNLPSTVVAVTQQIVNVGELRIYGAELEGQLIVTDGLTVSAQAGYTNGKYKDLRFDISSDGVINSADFALEPPRLSPWTYGAGVSYQLPIGTSGTLSSRLNYNHRDASFFTDNNRGRLNAIDDISANITLRLSADSPWTVSLYGNNLLDEVSFGGDTQLPDDARFGGDGPDGPRPPPTFSPLNKGRVVGLEARMTF